MAKSLEPGLSPLDGSNSPSIPLGETSLHRLSEVRTLQGFSLRTISRRTGIDVRELRRQENPHEDLRLSELVLWQRALEVPISELLNDSLDPLSPSVRDRAQLVRIMKTVVALAEVVTNARAQRMLMMLREQLLQLMPELDEIVGWPSFGSRRPSENMGKISEEPISVRAMFADQGEENV